jgi:hypothetical protein
LPGRNAELFFPENRIMNDHQAMLAIQQELDGVEWTADTLGCIAEILQQAGYRIRDLDDRETRTEDIPTGGRNSIKPAHIPGQFHVLAVLQESDVRRQIAAILERERRDFGGLTPNAVSDEEIHNACLSVAATTDAYLAKEVDLAAFRAAMTALCEVTRRLWGPVPILTPAPASD